ncbi:MAG: serine protease [Deltaproteobacteria bacterium]|nr:serine protease [Deltaproteobacteria bacterium]
MALALILLFFFWKFYYPGLSKEAELARIDPAGLANANVLALQSEIDRYRSALEGNVCLFPPLADSVPLFRPDPGFAATLDDGDVTGLDPGNRTYPAITPDVNSLLPDPLNPDAGDNIEASTVFIISDGKNATSTGTGFFINNNDILTNRHVVENALGSGDRVYVTNKSLGSLVPVKIASLSKPGQIYPDYAVLRLPANKTSGNFLRLSPDAKRTDRVGAWGYPELNVGMDPKYQELLEGDMTAVPEVVFSQGVISVVQNMDKVPIINHTAEVSHGNSGGPLVDQNGNAVGINTIIYVDPESNRQVNVALGSPDIIDFLRQNGIRFEESGRG